MKPFVDLGRFAL